jgi:hypothetical protein
MKNWFSKSGFVSSNALLSTFAAAGLSVGSLPVYKTLHEGFRILRVQGTLGSVRSALEIQRMQIMLRCNGTLDTPVHAAQLNKNDITWGDSAPCNRDQVRSPKERKFLTENISDNPFTHNNKVSECDYNEEDPCKSVGRSNTGGWCYDARADVIWANSNIAGECAY